MKTEEITYVEYINLIRGVSIDPKKYKGIICPLRGGFYIADYLSRKFDLPLHYIQLSSYEGRSCRDIRLGMHELLNPEHYLICDDIYDTGNTIKYIKEFYDCATFDSYTLIMKEQEISFRDYATMLYSKVVDKDTWVKFFWEHNKEQ